ncbi:hypothetical protein [Deinococcus sp. Leaf326]|jgi:hypothetical protein|uniref:hypothetical protein n=1 Tax=Deinococcus sp. Leaf326 TaxID=1736338 RepID=UPI0007015518|nr:hypothetical protein [Deinococcus sp. Leaf326]KQR27971.1 hypothetical protein ASF71_05165 [Deinococcus sp. Leaf326]
MSATSSAFTSKDPYRLWLLSRLGEEFGVKGAERIIQEAVLRRGWTTGRSLGPRDVVAVLQDVYRQMTENGDEARADRWLQDASRDLAKLAETVPEPAAPQEQAGEPAGTRPQVPVPAVPVPQPAAWGRRAHDLPLMLARVHAQIAARSLNTIRSDGTLARLERAAEWDMQAAQAEVRRWETEALLGQLRAAHARAELADQVATARAQAEVLRLNIRELEELPRPGQNAAAQLAHARLTLTQTQAFLDAFAPLVGTQDADAPLSMLQLDLHDARFSLGVALHPDVLRARYGLNVALWQAGEAGEEAPSVQEARRALAQAEEMAGAQLAGTLNAARSHQAALQDLARRALDLETRGDKLARAGGDALSRARLGLEWRQVRAAARLQAGRLEEAVALLEALVGEGTQGTDAPQS